MQRPQQGGRPAPNEAAPRGPQGDSRRGQTGFFQNAGRVITTRGGDTVHRDPAGRVSEVRVKNGGVVYHAPNGVRPKCASARRMSDWNSTIRANTR